MDSKRIEEARRDIIELVEKIGATPENRVSLGKHSKELLEKLLFKQLVVCFYSESIPEEYRGKPIIIKYLVWYGDFLSKIDLSEVSFDDVVWTRQYSSYFPREIINFLDKKDGPYAGAKLKNGKMVSLKSTNAKIDFSKTPFTRYFGLPVCISNCDFSGTDLSNNNLTNCIIDNSNFDNSNIKVSGINENKNNSEKTILVSSSFNNCDFTKFPEVYPTFFAKYSIFGGSYGDALSGEAPSIYGYKSSFINTGLKINLPKPNDDEKKFIRNHIKTIPAKSKPLVISREIVMYYIIESHGDSFSPSSGWSRKKYETLTATPEHFKGYNSTTYHYISGLCHLIEAMNSKLCGCFINGIEIRPIAERKAISNEKYNNALSDQNRKFDDMMQETKAHLHSLVRKKDNSNK